MTVEKETDENHKATEDPDDDGDNDDEEDDVTADHTSKKKKKRKKKKKKKKSPVQLEIKTPSLRPPARGLKETAYTDIYLKYGQTEPPTISVADVFEGKDFPAGEIQEYVNEGHSHRLNAAEMRARDRLQEDLLSKVRHGAEVHRQVRAFSQSIIRPGIELADMCNQIENMNRILVVEHGLDRGIGFPTGCSLNHVAAHYTPNTGDKTVLQYDDVMKVDFGVQVDGRIIDCAWTVAFNPQYDALLKSVQEATDTGIREAGIDVRLCDIGAAIQEVMESYEVEINGTTYPVKAIRNLNGHSST